MKGLPRGDGAGYVSALWWRANLPRVRRFGMFLTVFSESLPIYTAFAQALPGVRYTLDYKYNTPFGVFVVVD